MDSDSRIEPGKKVLFPKNGTWFYRLMHHTGFDLPRSYKWFKRVNKVFMVPLYRLRVLPLFGVGWMIVMITTVGRKTGKTRRTPLEFHRIEGVIHITAGRGEKTDWVRNIRANPDKVRVQVGFKSFQAKVEFIDDVLEKIQYIEWLVTKLPREAKTGFGWDPKEDTIENSDFTPLAKFLTVIKLHNPKTR
ncbi:MAG: nitroreductase family deazaflavin-dependent oxidoreductase [Candidatus Hodarchaeales archaeon]|jgi:deazaflavin-dependent oxidoreductase (nitroreductase family)